MNLQTGCMENYKLTDLDLHCFQKREICIYFSTFFQKSFGQYTRFWYFLHMYAQRPQIFINAHADSLMHQAGLEV